MVVILCERNMNFQYHRHGKIQLQDTDNKLDKFEECMQTIMYRWFLVLFASSYVHCTYVRITTHFNQDLNKSKQCKSRTLTAARNEAGHKSKFEQTRQQRNHEKNQAEHYTHVYYQYMYALLYYTCTHYYTMHQNEKVISMIEYNTESWNLEWNYATIRTSLTVRYNTYWSQQLLPLSFCCWITISQQCAQQSIMGPW